jgi:hypothetical protein
MQHSTAQHGMQHSQPDSLAGDSVGLNNMLGREGGPAGWGVCWLEERRPRCRRVMTEEGWTALPGCRVATPLTVIAVLKSLRAGLECGTQI